MNHPQSPKKQTQTNPISECRFLHKQNGAYTETISISPELVQRHQLTWPCANADYGCGHTPDVSGSSRSFAIISTSAMSTTPLVEGSGSTTPPYLASQEAMGATLIGLWLWSRRIQSNVVNVQCTTGTIAVNPNSQLRDILQVHA